MTIYNELKITLNKNNKQILHNTLILIYLINIKDYGLIRNIFNKNSFKQCLDR